MSEDWLGNVQRSVEEWNKQTAEGLKRIDQARLILAKNEVKVERSLSDVVFQVDRVRLLHYKPITKRAVPTPLLMVPALVNRYYILDLQPDRSMVRQYLERGIDVYMVDWGDPGPSDRYLTMADHIDYIDSMVDVIRKRTKLAKINIQGYCMGGTFCTIHASVHPEKVRNLIIYAAPIDFSSKSGILTIWSKYLDADKIVEAFGNVPAEFLNFGFLLINPVRLMFDKYVTFYQNLDKEAFVDNFLRMERWIFDSPDLPGETYRDFIKELYQKNLLTKNKLVVGGTRIDLKNIAMPLLVITAENDTLVPPDMSKPLMALVSSKDKKEMSFSGGHIGLSVSEKAIREFWPRVTEWLISRSKKIPARG